MNKRLLALLACLTLLIVVAPPTFAQLVGTDIKPGDPCTPAEEGYVARNASAARDPSEITLMCDGTQWQSATGASSSVWLDGGSGKIYYNGGNVGIGTASPAAKLSIFDAASLGVNISTGGDAAGEQATFNLLTKSDGTDAIGQASTLGWHIYARGDAYDAGTEKNDFGITFWNGTAFLRHFVIDNTTGNIALGYTAATGGKAKLDVNGSLRIADGAELCNSADHEGAIRYVAATDKFQMCRSSATGWEDIATGSGTSGITALTGDVTASGAGSVVATIAANAIGSAEITDGAVALADLAANSVDAAKIVDASIGLADLSATGTKNNTTFLRGDGTWAASGPTIFDAGSSTSINWANGTQQYTTASCGALTFSNMSDGGVYTLAVQGSTSATCSFSHTGLTFRMPPGHGATTASTHTLYSFARMGTVVYVSWMKGV